MHKIRLFLVILIAHAALAGVTTTHAETELVAALETLTGQVSLKRFPTDDFVQVRRESVVGVGDVIRTAANATARITFFANGTDTELLPDTEFRIDAFTGDEDRFTLSVTVLIGQTTQRISKLLDNGSSYKVNSQGLAMAVRGTVFDVRVETSGRSATVVREGTVQAVSPLGKQSAPVPTGFGVRSEPQGLSDVVEVADFAQLDAALDGCNAIIATIGDTRLNVRLGPDLGFQRIGVLDNRTRLRLFGRTESGWYRVQFKGTFAWVFLPAVQLDAACAGVRTFANDTPAEPIGSFSDLIVTPEPFFSTPTP